MADYLTNTADLTAVADSIRAKTGGTSQLEWPDEYVTEIGQLEKPKTETILWTNQNPDTATSGENINSLTRAVLEEYDEIMIVYKNDIAQSSDCALAKTSITRFLATGTSSYSAGICIAALSDGIWGRAIRYVLSADIVNITTASQMGVSSVNPEKTIPLKIIGVKI